MTFDHKVFLLFHIPGTQALTLQSVQESSYVRHFVFERREKPKVHFSNSSLLFHNKRHHSQFNIVDVKSRIMTYPQINPIRRHQPFRRQPSYIPLPSIHLMEFLLVIFFNSCKIRRILRERHGLRSAWPLFEPAL